jgi:hypothetical protein
LIVYFTWFYSVPKTCLFWKSNSTLKCPFSGPAPCPFEIVRSRNSSQFTGPNVLWIQIANFLDCGTSFVALLCTFSIDSKLTFEHHMNKKINKANSTMGLIVIRRTFTCLNEETFLLLYKARLGDLPWNLSNHVADQSSSFLTSLCSISLSLVETTCYTT